MTISVAPMEGVTTFPMRLWLQMTSQPVSMTSPFLRVTRTSPEDALPDTFVPELLLLRDTLPYQLIPQFITGDPEQLLRVSDLLPPALSPFIELNCGCPSPNSLGRLAGSGMLQDPEYFARTLEMLTQRLGPHRLAIKMRIGINDDAEFPALLHAIAALPLARLTVHARTRADGYRGRARWQAVQAAAQATTTPVHASGDILGIDSWRDLQQVAPAIQGGMVGRGLLRNPWVFAELRDGKRTRLEPLTFINALFAYLLLQDIFLKHPEKLLQKVAKGRLGHPCGTDFAAWEKTVVECTGLLFGMPFLLLNADVLQNCQISPVAFHRLRLLWLYLRSSLPEPFAQPSLLKSKQPLVFFQQLFMMAHEYKSTEWEVTHNPEWDKEFAKQRG